MKCVSLLQKEKEHKTGRKNTNKTSKDGKDTTKCVSQSTKYSS